MKGTREVKNMNQILATSNPTTKKAKKNSGPADIKTVVRVFAIAMLVFGVFMIGTGSYAIYKDNVDSNTEITKPVITESLNEDSTAVILTVTHDKAIDRIEYSWNDDEVQTITGNGRKYIEQEIEIPGGTNTLNVRAVDTQGQEISTQREYTVDDIINLTISENNKLKITAESPILFLDSGLGGLTTLFQTEMILPQENFIYVADFKNHPYGNKTKKQIESTVIHNIKKFYAQFYPKSVVLACNTATAVAITRLRKMFSNIIIIGTEPAIRPAIEAGKKRILVLGTRATIRHSSLIKLFKANKHSYLEFLALPELAKLVDDNYLDNKSLIDDYLAEKLTPLKDKFDAVVLGCTHYVILKKEIKNFLGDITIFSGNGGVAKRLKQCLTLLNLKNAGKGSLKLISTSSDKQEMLLENHNYLFKRREEICVV